MSPLFFSSFGLLIARLTMLRLLPFKATRGAVGCRRFTTSIRRLQEAAKPPPPPESSEQYHDDAHRKHKPLSRMPIGTEDDYSKMTIKRDPMEFVTWKSLALFVVVGVGMTWLFNDQKKKLELRREAEANRGMGKPLIGGPFNLIDENGNKFTDANLKGQWSIIYFGFTHCPDICPDELDDLGEIIDGLKSKYNLGFQPIFITCDPPRDTPEVMKEYLTDFHPGIIGLTGEYEEVKKCCKAYRVYFSTPKDVKPGQDYLVDHSIFFYLMDPEGQFTDVLGRNYDVKTAIEKIKDDMHAYLPPDQREKKKNGWLGFLYK